VLGRLGNPSPRVERLFNSLTAGCPRPHKTERRDRGLDAIARDNPADSLMHRGQMVFAVPSLHWARVHWKGKPDPYGPDAGQ